MSILKRLLLKGKTPLEKVYSSIETLPIWNWMMVHETGNLSYLKELDSYEVESDGRLESVWDKLYEQYFKAFGVSDEYLKRLRIRKKIALLQCELIATGDKTIKSFIGAEQEYLKEMDKGERMKFEDIIVAIEKFMGFPIDKMKVSTLKYYTYLNTLKKHYA